MQKAMDESLLEKESELNLVRSEQDELRLELERVRLELQARYTNQENNNVDFAKAAELENMLSRSEELRRNIQTSLEEKETLAADLTSHCDKLKGDLASSKNREQELSTKLRSTERKVKISFYFNFGPSFKL